MQMQMQKAKYTAEFKEEAVRQVIDRAQLMALSLVCCVRSMITWVYSEGSLSLRVCCNACRKVLL